MKSMLMKLGGRKSRDQFPKDGNHPFDEKTFNATVDLLEVFAKKSANDISFGAFADASTKDVDAIVTNIFNGENFAT